MTSSEDQATKNERTGRWALGLILVVAVCCAYGNSLNGPYVFDDEKNIRDRAEIHSRDSLGSLLTSTGRPALMLTLGVNYWMGDGDVRYFHITNVAVHIIAALLLMGLIRRTLLLPGIPSELHSRSGLLALSISILWALHPLQTQSVTYIIQRSESFMGMCYILALYCLLRGSQSRHSLPWYVGSIASVAVGMGFKAAIISAPIVFLCYDRAFLSNNWKALFRQRAFYHAGLGMLTLVFVFLMSHILNPSVKSAVGIGSGVTPWEYLRSQGGVIVHYLGLVFWPKALCLDYGWPVAQNAWDIYPAGALILALLGVSAATLWFAPRLGFIGMTFFWLLAPSSSFIPIIDLAFEHRTYLALACILVLVVVGIHTLLCRLLNDRKRQTACLIGLVGLLAVGCTIRTHLRNQDYQSPVSLWRSVTTIAPGNARGWYNLGVATGATGDLAGAIAHYRQAVSVDSGYARAHYNLARALAVRGDTDLAIEHYEAALDAKAEYAEASYNLAKLLVKEGHVPRAIARYQQALRSKPDYRDASYNLAGALTRNKQHKAAIEQYLRTLDIDPNDASASFNLGSLYYQLHRTDDAIAQYGHTLAINPHHHKARLILATILADAGKTEEAKTCYEQPIREFPNDPSFYDQFGMFYARRGEYENAADLFNQSLTVSSNYVPALVHLGMAYHELKRPSEAIRMLRRALQLQPDLPNAERLLSRLRPGAV